MIKFYSTKSNATRAAKAAHGEALEGVTIEKHDGGWVFVKTVDGKVESVSDENVVGNLKTMIAEAGSMVQINACELAISTAYNAGQIIEATRAALFKEASARVEALVAAQVAADAAKAAADAAPVDLDSLVLTHADNCPHCGICLDNGYTDFVGLREANADKTEAECLQMMSHQFACLACGGEWGAPIKLNRSKIDNPCRAVWDIADAMPGAKRKDVLTACEQAGIAYYTARTQYQLWRTVQKEMEERAAAKVKTN